MTRRHRWSDLQSADRSPEPSARRCVFCTMLEIGPCDYEEELRPFSGIPAISAASPMSHHAAEKGLQESWIKEFLGSEDVPEQMTGVASVGGEDASQSRLGGTGPGRGAPPRSLSLFPFTPAATAGWRLSGEPRAQVSRPGGKRTRVKYKEARQEKAAKQVSEKTSLTPTVPTTPSGGIELEKRK